MKRAKILSAALALSIALASCASPGPAPAPDSPPDPDPALAPSPTPEYSAPRPSHITRELTEGVRVDADITYPEKAEYDCFSTNAPELTPELLEDIFLTGDPSPRTVTQLEDPDEWPEYAGFFAVDTENGSRVRWMNGSLSYYAPADGDGKRAATIEEVLWDLANTTPVNDVELPGLARADAEAAVTGILEKLDMIGTPEIAAFVGLDHEAIEEYSADLLSREDYRWAVEIGKLVELKDLTEADDAYYIRLRFTLDGLPLYGDGDRRLEFAGDSMYVTDASVGAYFLGGELTDFFLEGCFSLSVAEVRREEVIDPDTLLEKVRDKYDLEILNDPMTITRIYMEYLPFRKTNVDFDLRPYWVLEYGYTADGQFDDAGAERFNAVTGEDAAYGG